MNIYSASRLLPHRITDKALEYSPDLNEWQTYDIELRTAVLVNNIRKNELEKRSLRHRQPVKWQTASNSQVRKAERTEAIHRNNFIHSRRCLIMKQRVVHLYSHNDDISLDKCTIGKKIAAIVS